MTMQITLNPRRQHDRREEAERAVEIFYPAGFYYTVKRHRWVAGNLSVLSWVVEVSDDYGFLGYAWDQKEEGEL